ncbi:ABC transporter permease [Microbacterium terrisoli]|uniref:ABC transporter permease n=1 Tax=Microbacterium terrisoli TaxID=3242192 RepID=UPI00280434AE|nr:ABC transporter permease [Microbacterium protaetiae]
MLDTLLAGVIHGGTYALIALGISLIFGVANIINFAHGSVYAIGGMLGWVFTGLLGWPLWSALIGVACATAVVGIVIHMVAVRPLHKSPHIAALLATFAVSILLDNISQLVFGPDTRSYPDLLPTANLHIAGFTFGTLDVVILAVCVAAMAAVAGFLRLTKYGRAVRATAQDREAAVMMGIPVVRTEVIVFAVASAVGGVGGVLVGMYNTVTTPMAGLQAMLTGFTAATLGGLGSLAGAVVGGVLLGVVEAFGVTWIGAGASNLIIFGVLVLTLWFRPQGVIATKRTTALSVEPLTGTFLGGGRPIRLKWWQVAVLSVAAIGVLPFVLNAYWLTVGTQVIIYAILGLSLVLVSGLAGQVVLGQVGPMAIGAYGVALLTTTQHWQFLPALLAGAGIAAVLSTVIMAPSWKLSGHYISMQTLGIGLVTVAVILNLGWLTRGPRGVLGIPRPELFGISFATPQALYVLDAVILGIVLVVVALLQRSHLGTIWHAVGNDQVALRATGLHPSHYKSLAFAVGAFIAGIAGGLLATQYTYIDPTIFTPDISILALTVIVLGGMRSPFGAVLGAAVLIAAPELLRITDAGRLLFYGAVMLALVLFRPRGLWARKA